MLVNLILPILFSGFYFLVNTFNSKSLSNKDYTINQQNGKIEEMGDSDDIYNSPKTEYTKRLIEAVPEGKTEDIKKTVT